MVVENLEDLEDLAQVYVVVVLAQVYVVVVLAYEKEEEEPSAARRLCRARYVSIAARNHFLFRSVGI